MSTVVICICDKRDFTTGKGYEVKFRCDRYVTVKDDTGDIVPLFNREYLSLEQYRQLQIQKDIRMIIPEINCLESGDTIEMVCIKPIHKRFVGEEIFFTPGNTYTLRKSFVGKAGNTHLNYIENGQSINTCFFIQPVEPMAEESLRSIRTYESNVDDPLVLLCDYFVTLSTYREQQIENVLNE